MVTGQLVTTCSPATPPPGVRRLAGLATPPAPPTSTLPGGGGAGCGGAAVGWVSLDREAGVWAEL